PDGKSVLWQTSRPEVIVASLDGSQVRHYPFWGNQSGWMPDGAKLVAFDINPITGDYVSAIILDKSTAQMTARVPLQPTISWATELSVLRGNQIFAHDAWRSRFATAVQGGKPHTVRISRLDSLNSVRFFRYRLVADRAETERHLIQ